MSYSKVIVAERTTLLCQCSVQTDTASITHIPHSILHRVKAQDQKQVGFTAPPPKICRKHPLTHQFMLSTLTSVPSVAATPFISIIEVFPDPS